MCIRDRLACVFFIWRMGTLFRVTELDAQGPPGEPRQALQAFELYGSLFFGAVGQLEDLPGRVGTDTRTVVLDMHRLVSMDTSGLEALRHLRQALRRREVVLVLARMNEQPLSLVRRSGFADELGAGGIVDAWPPRRAGTQTAAEPAAQAAQRDLFG